MQSLKSEFYRTFLSAEKFAKLAALKYVLKGISEINFFVLKFLSKLIGVYCK